MSAKAVITPKNVTVDLEAPNAEQDVAAEEPKEEEPPKPSPHSILGPVYLCVLIDSLGLGLVIPILPYYALQFGATPLQLGLVMAAYSAAQMVGATVMGWASDRVGRPATLLASLLGSAGAFFLAGFANSIEFLIMSRAVGGIMGGSIPVAHAFIADGTPFQPISTPC